MRAAYLLAAISFLGGAVGMNTVRQSKTAASNTSEEVIAVEKASFAAWQHKDSAFFSQYLSPDATFFMPDNPYLDTDPELNFLSKFNENVERDKIVDWTMYNPRVQEYGDAAVLTYNEAATHNTDGQLVARTLKVSIVFVKRNGRWQLVHEHASANAQAR
jgi:uncharacterized protein (TIGR02246 family)